MTAKQSENGMVMKTRTIEKKVRRWAQIPGPSSHAGKEKNQIFTKKNLTNFVVSCYKQNKKFTGLIEVR